MSIMIDYANKDWLVSQPSQKLNRIDGLILASITLLLFVGIVLPIIPFKSEL